MSQVLEMTDEKLAERMMDAKNLAALEHALTQNEATALQGKEDLELMRAAQAKVQAALDLAAAELLRLQGIEPCKLWSDIKSMSSADLLDQILIFKKLLKRRPIALSKEAANKPARMSLLATLIADEYGDDAKDCSREALVQAAQTTVRSSRAQAHNQHAPRRAMLTRRTLPAPRRRRANGRSRTTRRTPGRSGAVSTGTGGSRRSSACAWRATRSSSSSTGRRSSGESGTRRGSLLPTSP